MKRLTISLDDAIHQALTELAEEEERSISNLVSVIVKQVMKERLLEKKPVKASSNRT